jgi:hypothetical protein
MTNTTEANWTALPEGTSAGATIGTAGATTFGATVKKSKEHKTESEI